MKLIIKKKIGDKIDRNDFRFFKRKTRKAI